MKGVSNHASGNDHQIMADHKYHYDVVMTCTGCSGAVDRALKRMNGVKEINISLEKQSVDVITAPDVSYDAVLEKIKKTGKEVRGGETVI